MQTLRPPFEPLPPTERSKARKYVALDLGRTNFGEMISSLHSFLS